VSGRVRVYKVGGPALEDPGLVVPLADEVRRGEGRAVLVHGGGRAVDRLLKALGIESRFVDGRRETSPEAMDVVEMVLSGLANKALAAGLTSAGVPAVGISGRDGGLVRARLEPGLGRVGTPDRVDVAPLRAEAPARPDVVRERASTFEALRVALGRLPLRYGAPVQLYYLQGYSLRETARLLGTSASSVKMRLVRARLQLRTSMAGMLEPHTTWEPAAEATATGRPQVREGGPHAP